MLKLRLRERWQRLQISGSDQVVMLLLSVMVGLCIAAALWTAKPKSGCIRLGRGNSGPISCDPQVIAGEAMNIVLFGLLFAAPLLYMLGRLLVQLFRPLNSQP
ncbi:MULTISPECIES: hypothetical protein [Pseudomonas]|uniref:hypothetical protein n=1 Tax=Pseudomonas TaxID=286 RepID=UPI00132EFD1D|nr:MULTISPECIES: hypothetical protein [Pseudomonas]MBF4208634.1 hypothetical protein [Pseudomonas donghuensis]QHF30485.1 hypothetical protein PspR32_22900 [Pseudomonas sp. R32]UVL23797.1 hypothetical protein LOY30_23780 [Pseudomonas donghuensis]